MGKTNKRIVGALAVAAALCGGAWLGRTDSRADAPPSAAAASSADAPPSTAALPEPVTAGQESKIQNPKSKISAVAALHLQGVSTCASAACHGGPDSGRADEKWRSAYTVWATQDQHTRAYTVLFDERARRIVALLDHVDAKQSRPWRDERCLACHATPGHTAESVDRSAVLADGVGCEACHGPAERWLGEHTKSTWATTENRYGPEWGMRNTDDLRVRAETCAGCHVGSRAADGQPARDVNHELIAAGHPRLNFEFGAYLANMPRHWNERADRLRHPDYEARVWAVGQGVSAIAALDLLAARAEQAEKEPQAGAAEHRAGDWPEFSEYQCFACHHDLRERALPSTAEHRHQPGTLPWGTWYFSRKYDWVVLGYLQAENPPRPGWDEKVTETIRQLNALADEMGAPRPDAAKVRAMAKGAAKAMSEFLPPIEQWPDDSRGMGLLRGSLHPAPNSGPASAESTDWDSAAQEYLELVAFVAAHRDLRPAGTKPSAGDQKMTAALEDLRRTLEFPIVVEAGATPSAPPRKLKFDSPRDFDPAEFQKALRRVRDVFDSMEP